jgi:hypothetical protein
MEVIGYCYHLVNVISLSLSYGDPIKWRLLYQAIEQKIYLRYFFNQPNQISF